MTPSTPKRGRPRSIPAGTRVRGIRMTDAEWAAVKQFLKQRRKRGGTRAGK